MKFTPELNLGWTLIAGESEQTKEENRKSVTNDRIWPLSKAAKLLTESMRKKLV